MVAKGCAECCSTPSPVVRPDLRSQSADDFRGVRLPGRVFDPEGVEVRELCGTARFEGARVLEIGAGGGRLSFRYADRPAQVVGVDLSSDNARTAHRSCPERLSGRLHFHPADALHLPFRGGAFDIALLGWSL